MKKHFDRIGWWAATLAVGLVLAACGGGGGGAAPAGAGGVTPVSTFSDVSISLKSPASVRDVTYEGLPAHHLSMEIGYAGDIATLAGRTIHIKVVQPEDVFGADVNVVPGISDQTVIVSVVGNERRELVAGNMRGTLLVHACLDANCSTQLQNSPLSIDYDIEVRAGLRLSSPGVQQSVPYGSVVSPRVIEVTMPEEASLWDYVPLRDVQGASSSSLALVPGWLQRSGDTLTFQPPANLLPGTYAWEFQATTVVPDWRAPSVPQLLTRRFTVSHTVVPTGIYAITPSTAVLAASLSGLPLEIPLPQLVSQVGGSFSHRGVRTDEFPVAATGDPLLPNWLALFPSPEIPSYSVNYCDRVAGTCLPIGTYRGAVLLRHTGPDAAQTDFELPVTFTLTP
jgi:hypothetical protein